MNKITSVIKIHDVIFLLAIAVYVITAYNSLGYHQADEHYQIIEFAGTKLGTHMAEDLPWEYRDQIRPTLQPTMVYAIFKTLNAFSITNKNVINPPIGIAE